MPRPSDLLGVGRLTAIPLANVEIRQEAHVLARTRHSIADHSRRIRTGSWTDLTGTPPQLALRWALVKS